MSSRLIIGLSANIAGGLVPMAVTLIVTPFYLHLIGLERFGILSLIWLLLGYLGIFDFGFGRTVASAVARENDEHRRADFFWTGLALSTVGGLAGALVAYGISRFFFDQIFSVSSDLSGEIRKALLTLVAILPLVTISSVLTGVSPGARTVRETKYRPVSRYYPVSDRSTTGRMADFCRTSMARGGRASWKAGGSSAALRLLSITVNRSADTPF